MINRKQFAILAALIATNTSVMSHVQASPQSHGHAPTQPVASGLKVTMGMDESISNRLPKTVRESKS